MDKWTKIVLERPYDPPGLCVSPPDPASKGRYSRGKLNTAAVQVINGKRVSIMSDGRGVFALKFGDNEDYAVSLRKDGFGAGVYLHGIPAGKYYLQKEGDVWVLLPK